MRFEFDPLLTAALREEIIGLWLDVSNTGGAVGFVAPVTVADIEPTANAAFARLDSGEDRLLLGFADDKLVAMLIFVRGFKLTEHWRTIKRVMVHPGTQGKGYGAELMREGERVARECGWEGLFLTVRGGLGLERFYSALGYKEVGRLPGTLRVAPGDDRDEILMWLALS
ncbi:MAG TPA: GNAT family N-acetyltransferase [Micromonosporaceae bacterium]|nr:GNAT family N-acetyltransferase [Micromonosporaceae bacterium]